MSRPASIAAPLLALAATPEQARALQLELLEMGETDVVAADCPALVQWVDAGAPRQVACRLPEGPAALLQAMQGWQGVAPCPVTFIGPVFDAAALVQAGVASHCSQMAALPLALAEARARFARELDLRDAAAAARAQLEDRKWIDRAKGVLMSARSIAEDEAFRLLRGAAMHANLKLVEVSRSVVDAARWADAINRAGQLRMLSQRLVALAAQQLLRVDGAAARRAAAEQRARANIEHLAALGLDADAAAALQQVNRAWAGLEAALGQRLSTGSLPRADAGAEALLQAADALVHAVETLAARRVLGIVNLCGRQRLHTMRLAKQALLAKLLPHAGYARGVPQMIDGFDRALREIEAAPLSSPEIRSALAAAQDGWRLMLRALDAADPASLAHASEALLGHLDRLTEGCEHSLQLLMS